MAWMQTTQALETTYGVSLCVVLHQQAAAKKKSKSANLAQFETVHRQLITMTSSMLSGKTTGAHLQQGEQAAQAPFCFKCAMSSATRFCSSVYSCGR
jgi:hypothetical protein